jgi:DNA-binding transcriptional ArsR family regulator
VISPTFAVREPAAPDAPASHKDDVAALVQLGKLFSDETRVRILALLAEHDELCVRDLWESLAQTQPGVSHHLALLREGGLVESQQAGRNIFYRLDLQQIGQLLEEISRTPLGARALESLAETRAL